MRVNTSMRGVCCLAFVAALAGLIKADSSIYSGLLGCRFSEAVCRQDEECIDDRLFGTCQRANRRKDRYQYFLDSIQLRDLEQEIGRLIREGRTWEDLYTQCVLSNILLAYRNERDYDEEFCDNGGISQNALQQELTDSTVELLKSYLEDYYNVIASSNPAAQDVKYPDYTSLDYDIGNSFASSPLSMSQFYPDNEFVERPNPEVKKDEVVQVHKYLKSHKRDPLASSSQFTDYPYVLDKENLDYGDTSYPGSQRDAGIDYEYDGFLQSLTPEKLALLQEYLGPLSEDKIDADASDSQAVDLDQVFYDDDSQAPASKDDDYGVGMMIDEEDAKLLDELLQGKVDVSDMSDEQIDHLTKYVDGMLSSIKQYGSSEDSAALGSDDAPTPGLLEPPAAEKPMEQDVDEEDVSVHKAVKKEQLNSEALESPADSDVVEEAGSDEDYLVEPVEPLPPSNHKYEVVDTGITYLKIKPDMKDKADAANVIIVLQRYLGLSPDDFSNIVVSKDEISFRVDVDRSGLNASNVATLARVHAEQIQNDTGFLIYEAGIGSDQSEVSVEPGNEPKYIVLTFVLCGVVAGIVLAVMAIYILRRHLQSKEKLAQLAGAADGVEASNDYQDLCRQRMQSKSSEKPEPLHVAARVGSVSTTETAIRSPSSRSSTSSWSEEPVTSNMDISTGHIVLAYMEDHLQNKGRLDQEWEGLCAYDAEPNSTTTANESSNMRKNRYSDILPYDHSRVVLASATNVSGSDYINASTITDHDPRNPAYIATQGPLPHTVADFWQMVWEQGSVVIVNLTKLTENGQAMCHRYWPEEGSDLYHIYEVHLVSEHIWCDDYLVRSFYLKNLQTNETRTVTQFHFLTWPDLGIPGSAKALLDFRRKVNKSYRGRSCPIMVHCSDGSGRTGTYSLVDMVLNRMSKGAKEIDIAATLEHIRDQRMLMVKTKEQFEFALAAVAEEVHAILKALPQ